MAYCSIGQRNQHLLGPITIPANCSVVPSQHHSITPFSVAGFDSTRDRDLHSNPDCD
jgi:hypothetical protein